ncbi:hypothetical protein BDR26DRAFT_893175 [Obelidium mucronatum]|nr:hypothetical protein BDR26DRAFT_893175 [Obelidium mucronatum]
MCGIFYQDQASTDTGGLLLPLTYKAAIYKEIMSASVWAETNADYEAGNPPPNRSITDSILSGAETNKRMSFRWPLDPKQRLAIFNLLIDNGFGKESGWNYAIQMAAYENHVDAIRLVLAHPSIRVNSSVNNNFLIRRASEMGNFCVRKAVEYGWHEVAGILLKDHRVNASAGNDFCLRKAVGNQDARMVKMLLDIGQLNPSIAISTTCFKTAVENELFDIARLLLDARIFMNPAASDNYILKLVVSQGHVEFVDALLLDERVICNMTQEAIHQSREDAKSARESSFYEETM